MPEHECACPDEDFHPIADSPAEQFVIRETWSSANPAITAGSGGSVQVIPVERGPAAPQGLFHQKVGYALPWGAVSWSLFLPLVAAFAEAVKEAIDKGETSWVRLVTVGGTAALFAAWKALQLWVAHRDPKIKPLG